MVPSVGARVPAGRSASNGSEGPGHLVPPPRSALSFTVSEKEAAAEAAEIRKALAERDRKVAAGICPECGEGLEPRRLDGCCIYGACGHRIGHGRL